MIDIFREAGKLPPEWDSAAGRNFALFRDNLILLEEVNPCNQTYVFLKSHEASSIIVHYELKLNIFCYSRLKLNMPVTVIGIPCSVSEPGYSISRGHMGKVSEYLTCLRGAKIILNAGDDFSFPGFAKGYTLPACIMKINYDSFDEYLQCLRSHYRYRYKKALRKAKELSVGILKNDFSQKHYSLYEQVYAKSEYKLEKLPDDFFRKSKASIIEFKLKDEPVAFIQYSIVDKEMIFLFGGLNYKLNAKYDLYLNMLLYLVKLAVENNCISLNLGQTAEEIKCRLGAFQEKKYLYIHHSNPVINKLASMFKSALCYRMKDIKLTVLKGSDSTRN